jgi:hypothetical protein
MFEAETSEDGKKITRWFVKARIYFVLEGLSDDSRY